MTAGIFPNIISVLILHVALNAWVVPFFDLTTLPDVFRTNRSLTHINATLDATVIMDNGLMNITNAIYNITSGA